MDDELAIVNRGRGPQLSSSRITVQDLLPYLQRKCTYDQILEVMPILTVPEIQAVERYVAEHYQEVMDQDQRIRERLAKHKNSPEVEEILRRGGKKLEELRERFAKDKHQPGRQRARNGDSITG